MRICSRLARLFALCLCVLALSGRYAPAQDYPSKPIKFIVCFAAGGPNDIVARLFSQYLSEHFKQQFVVENRPGAGGNIGMASGLASAPDGYTIVFAGPNNFINATMYEKLPFEFVRDAAPITGTMKLTNVLVVNSEFPDKTLRDYIARAKADPGKVSFGSGGVGTSPHMSGELLKSMAGINILHVPYRGTAPAIVDLLAGQINSVVDNLPGAIGHIKGGKLRALGVTAPKRVASLPDVPAIAEAVPGYEADVYYGVVAPKATPPEIVAKLNAGFAAVLKNPKLLERIKELGAEPMPTTPAEFGTLTKAQTEKWAKVITTAGIKIQQ